MHKSLVSPPLSKTNRWMDGQAGRQADRQTDIQMNQQAGKQTCLRHTDEKTGRQADRHVFETHMNKQMDMFQKDR